MPDTHTDLRTLPLPIDFVFFRPGASQWLTSINPMFEILSFDDIVGDELHTTRLGVAKAYAAAVFVMLCLADVYHSGHDSQDCR